MEAAVSGNNSPANRPSVPSHKVSAWHSKAPHIACKPSACKPAASDKSRHTSDSSESKDCPRPNPSSPKSSSSSRRQSRGSHPAAPSPRWRGTAFPRQTSIAKWSLSALSFGNTPWRKGWALLKSKSASDRSSPVLFVTQTARETSDQSAQDIHYFAGTGSCGIGSGAAAGSGTNPVLGIGILLKRICQPPPSPL